ncbi:MAG: hypothetical protein WKF37_09135 [Bryobacteraceae bacterium]
MVKIFGIVMIAAAIAFGANPASVPVENTVMVKKAAKKKGIRNVLRSSVAFVIESAAFGTSQYR